MNRKIGFLFALLYSLFVSSLFFYIGRIENQALVETISSKFKNDSQNSLERVTHSVKKNLLQGNLLSARSRLNDLILGTAVEGFVIRTHGKVDHVYFVKFEKDDLLEIEVPVNFSSRGGRWGSVIYFVNQKEIKEFEKMLNANLLRSVYILWGVLLVSVILLYILLGVFSESLKLHFKAAMSGGGLHRRLRGLGKLWKPLINDMYKTGEEIDDLKFRFDRLKRDAEVFAKATQISHDIRSPLGALKVISQSSEGLRELERLVLDKAVKRIEGIAEDILLSAKQQIGERIQKDKVFELAKDVEREFSFKGRDIFFALEDNDQKGKEIVANPVGLQNIFSNLLNNAFEASNGTPVYFRIVAEDDGLIIEIKDEGDGMTKEQQEKALKGEWTSKSQGNSLGLSGAKSLVEAWDASFSVDSEKGKGTLIQISFPWAK